MTTISNDITPSANTPQDGGKDVVAEFVERFGETWANPDPERLNALVHPDIEFIQPLESPVSGHRAAAGFWRRLFTLIPDLHGEILSWGCGDGIVYIELRMSGTLGGRPIEWVTLDRIRLENGKVRHRIAYFDPLPLVRAVVTRPRAWRHWAATQRLRLTH